MRPIKFRGKSLQTDKWVEGMLLKNKLGCYIVTEDNPHECTQYGYLEINEYERVIPETVGQYTGLKDKDGTEIWEGDIVCDRYANYYTPILRNGIYMAYNVDYLHLTEQEPSTQFNVVWKDGCEVIGNIFENPELLAGLGIVGL